MTSERDPDAVRPLVTTRIGGGVSPRVAVIALGAVLIAVVSIGVLGREPVKPPVPTGLALASLQAATPSPAVEPWPSPTFVDAFLPGPPYMSWEPPNELYQIIATADGQTIKTFVLPADDPHFEGSLSIRGLHHPKVRIDLISVEPDREPPPAVRIGSWKIDVPDGLTRAEGREVLKAKAEPATDDEGTPLLLHSGYQITITAGTFGKYLSLDFFIVVGDGFTHRWVTGDDGLVGWPPGTDGD